jgi:hypothetical protein
MMLEVLKCAPGTDPSGLIVPGKRRRRQEDYRDGDQAIRGESFPMMLRWAAPSCGKEGSGVADRRIPPLLVGTSATVSGRTRR